MLPRVLADLLPPAARWRRHALRLALVLAGAALACGGSDGSQDDVDQAGRSASGPVAEAAAAERPPNERPLPAFEGVTLDDRSLAVRDLLGKRFLLFAFNPEIDAAGPVAEAVQALSALRRDHNFEILGVATGSRRSEARRFAEAHDLDFPVLDDSTGRIAARLRLPVPVMLATVDADGYVTRTMGWREGGGPGVADATRMLRELLRLPALPASTHPVLGETPPAPEVADTTLSGDAFRLSEQRGRPVVLVFFLHTCPHCHHALEFLKEQLPGLPEAKRPQVVGVSVVDNAYAVRDRLEQDDLDYFPVLLDPDEAIRDAYQTGQGVPELVLIDAQGRIVHRSHGWDGRRDPALWRMWLARVSDASVPMLLHKTGYSGDAFCGVCHETQAATHALTRHAYAFDTLVKHGVDRSPDCVGCHVVGFGEPGGYTIAEPAPHLEGVGCESCHGRGGPHLSPDFVEGGDYEPVCTTCHDAKHSLGFEYATFLPRVSHAANAHLLGLSLAEKLERIEALGGVRKDILPGDAAYVGSDACRDCHAAEYETWAGNPHADAGKTLAEKGKAGDAECLACHTTGFGKPGGFPEGAGALDHPDLGRVGCESCHGPGGEHVGPDAARRGTIVSLTDKCDSCVILQICGACHDDQNDPGFEFRVQEGIERLRHGTIEPSAGAAAADLSDSAVLGLLEHALGHAEPAG